MEKQFMQQIENLLAKNKARISKFQGRKNSIKVVGIGGAGQNILGSMIKGQIVGVTFIAVETDFQSLKSSSAPIKIQLGVKTTKGLGTSSTPEKGRKAAQESLKEIIGAIEGADVVILVAGMGGGTGTGATQIIASAAKTLGIFTIGIFSLPFSREGEIRTEKAKNGISEIKNTLNGVIAVSNDELMPTTRPGSDILEKFKEGDEILCEAVRCILDRLNSDNVFSTNEPDDEMLKKPPIEPTKVLIESENIKKTEESTVVCWECNREYSYTRDSCPYCGKWNLIKRKKDKFILLLSGITFAILIICTLAYFYNNYNKEAKRQKAIAETIRLENERNKAKEDAIRLEAERKKAIEDAPRLEAERKKAKEQGPKNRVIFCQKAEELMLSKGIDKTIRASGNDKTTLTQTYVLYNRATSYQEVNDGLSIPLWTSLGFKKVVFSNGFGQSWSYKLH